MKTALALAAALGLSVSAAFAACPGHHVSASVDEELVVANVATPGDAETIIKEKEAE